MNLTRTMLLVSSAALVSLTVACHSTDPSPMPGQSDPVPAPYNDPQISVADPDLQEWLGFQTPVVVFNANTPMTVTVPVRNLADDRYTIDYRFLFFDEMNRQLEPAMNWRPAMINPKAVEQLQASALDTRAQNWKLQVKWANR